MYVISDVHKILCTRIYGSLSNPGVLMGIPLYMFTMKAETVDSQEILLVTTATVNNFSL